MFIYNIITYFFIKIKSSISFWQACPQGRHLLLLLNPPRFFLLLEMILRHTRLIKNFFKRKSPSYAQLGLFSKGINSGKKNVKYRRHKAGARYVRLGWFTLLANLWFANARTTLSFRKIAYEANFQHFAARYVWDKASPKTGAHYGERPGIYALGLWEKRYALG